MLLTRVKSFCVGKLALAVAALGLMVASSAIAATGNTQSGKKIYMEKCWWCHGKEGEADGPAAKFLIPPPRDFSAGVFKYKTSGPKSDIPRDEDLFRMISNGMPGTGMPSWKGILDDQQRWDLVAFVKSLTDMFEDTKNPPEMNYGTQVPSSPESIEKGKKLFVEAKCFECHGKSGKGSLMKKLKEDTGQRVWPRNFTKPWTFRDGHTPKSIFARITNGIPNTPMPSLAADKTGSGKLSVEDRWNVVNFVMSLADDKRRVEEGKTVVKGIQADQLPKDENDPAWDKASSTAFFMVPQIIQKDRFFTPSNDLVMVKAMFNDKELAFLLEWDDRTKSIPGDKVAEGLAWQGLTPDAFAVQTPVEIPTAAEKPYFGHGDASHPVSLLYWRAQDVDNPNVSAMLTASGTHKREPGDAKSAGFITTASYNDGTWKVMMKRKMITPNKDKDTQFEVGKYIPIAFANWDGSNGESGSKHTLTAWYWLLLEPKAGPGVYGYPLAVFLILVGGQFVFSIYGRKNNG